MTPLLLLVTYTAKTGMREHFLYDIQESAILDTIRGEDGCLAYDYFLAAEDADRLLLVEKWASPKQQQTHMDQLHMKALGEIKERWIARTHVERIYFEEGDQK